MLGEVARLVADIPRGSTPEVVWTLGSSELLVHTDTARVKFTSGVVWFRVMVECDQVNGRARITIPFAVGTKDKPTGLVMGTYDIVEGPPAIVEQWSDALIAFGWECVLELGQRLSAEMGDDASGRSLIPGSITAAPGKLIIQPMARHDLLTRAGR